MDKTVRLMFQDKAGFGRINKPKYCWCKKGKRSTISCRHIREYRYAYGAAEPLTGDGFFHVLPYCNTICMEVFLKELSKTYMKLSDRLLLGKQAVIESVNDFLKNICQTEHSRHRSFYNFIVSLIFGVAAYSFIPKKPSIRFGRFVDSICN